MTCRAIACSIFEGGKDISSLKKDEIAFEVYTESFLISSIFELTVSTNIIISGGSSSKEELCLFTEEIYTVSTHHGFLKIVINFSNDKETHSVNRAIRYIDVKHHFSVVLVCIYKYEIFQCSLDPKSDHQSTAQSIT